MLGIACWNLPEQHNKSPMNFSLHARVNNAELEHTFSPNDNA